MSNKSGTGGRRYFLLSTHNTHTRFSQAFKLHSVEKNTSKFQAHIILAISEFVPIYSFIHTSDPFLNWQFDIPYWRESRPFPELILHSTELRLKGIWKKPSIALSKIFLKQVPSSNAVQWIYEITQSSGLLMEAWKCWICVVVYYKRLR